MSPGRLLCLGCTVHVLAAPFLMATISPIQYSSAFVIIELLRLSTTPCPSGEHGQPTAQWTAFERRRNHYADGTTLH